MQARMNRPLLSATIACVVAVLVGGAAFAQGTNVGTWKLNVAKSKYDPGPAPKSGTTKIDVVGASTKTTVDQARSDGSVGTGNSARMKTGKIIPLQATIRMPTWWP